MLRTVFTYPIFFLIVAMCSFCTPAISQDLSTAQTYALNSQVRVLTETERRMTLPEVMQQQDKFVLYLDDNANYGFRQQGIWFQVRLNNQTDIARWTASVAFAQLDNLDFYLVINRALVTHSAQGKLPAQQAYRLPSLTMQLPQHVEATLYIRAENRSSSLILPLSIRPESAFVRLMLLDNLAWGLFYGGLFILALYNGVSYLSTREPSLLAYIAYVLAVMTWQMVWGGHLHWLFTDIPEWITQNTHLIFSLIGITSGVFTLTFLNTKQYARLAHPLILTTLMLQLLFGIASVLLPLAHSVKNTMVYALGLLAICTYVMAGFEAFYQRFQPARYFIIAWGALSLGAVIGMLSLLGIAPSNAFTSYCFQAGVFFEACLFSIALLDKQRGLLQADIAQATQDLRNNIEYIEEQNVRLDIARKDALKASQVKSQFLANMSHEIRTPLNAIIGFSRELAQAKLPEPQIEQVQIINSAADTLLSIVNDVLDFSKIEAGKLQLNNQPYAPTQLFEEVVEVMAKSAHNKGLDFIFSMTPLPDKVIGDQYRLKQVLNNLLSNALKFTSTGSIHLSVVATSLPHGLVEFAINVKDTGIGISRNDQHKLFSAFSQVDDALNRQYQGTGLGLVISREIIRLMGGNMDLVSLPHVGSIFSFTTRCNVLSYKNSLSVHAAWLGKRVLILDPLPENRRAIAKMLSCLGARVTSAESIAFVASLQQQFDVLLCALPVSKLPHRMAYLSAAAKVTAKCRILLYADQPPHVFDQQIADSFQQQVRLPITPSKLQRIMSPAGKSSSMPTQAVLNKLPSARVLAVDDMEMNLKLLHTWFQASPIQLTLSMSGQDALRQCQTQEFDLILMDIQMPTMDGVTASQHIRRTELNAGTPIIAVTAHVFKEEKDRLLSSGLDDYLPKPLNFDDLCHLIQCWCAPVEEPVEKTFDWSLALARSNQMPALAQDLLRDFLVYLPQSMTQLEACLQAQQWHEMTEEAHRLHGACAYTGVPKLQRMVSELEGHLRLAQYAQVSQLMASVKQEVNAIMSHQALAKEASALAP